MRRSSFTRAAAVVLMGLLVPAACAETAPSAAWVRQIGTTGTDISFGVAVDSAGNAFISGSTLGSLGGPNSGGQDVFLAKYNAAGAFQWSRQIGTTDGDLCYGVAVDGTGNAFISGLTFGSLGGPNAGDADAFLTKYNAAGTVQWSRQIGTAAYDEGTRVAVDRAGNAIISGSTRGSIGGPSSGQTDAFVTKYDAAGTLQWSRQIGVSGDNTFGMAVAADGTGNIFISGHTDGSIGGPSSGASDAFVTKYDSAGTLQWSRQFGTPDDDSVHSLAVDGAGNAYVAGYSYLSLDGAATAYVDAFLTKYDAAGTLQWTRQIATTAVDCGLGVAVDGGGNAFISGYTLGSLGGPNGGGQDAFLVKYDAAGTLLWSTQLGTADRDYGYDVAVDGAGNAFINGYTEGSLDGLNSGSFDAFLVKLDGGGTPLPEPSAMCVLAAVGLLALRRRRGAFR